MKHTGAIALVWLVQALSLGAAATAAASPQSKPQAVTIKDLVDKLQAREKSLKSVDMEFFTKDRFPGGGRIETHGRLRVLPGTHFHTSVQVRFEDEIRSEMQTVVTPDGVWTKRRDPIEEVYLFMKPELKKEMEAKSRKLGGPSQKLPGPVVAPNMGLLGAATLTSLNQQFELKVVGKKEADGTRYLVLSGDRRKPKDDSEQKRGEGPMGVPIPEKVTVWVREADAIPMRMTQVDAAGKPLLSFEVKKLELDKRLDPASFKIDKPADANFIDVEKHPPSWAQILRVREAFTEMQEKDVRPVVDGLLKRTQDPKVAERDLADNKKLTDEQRKVALDLFKRRIAEGKKD